MAEQDAAAHIEQARAAEAAFDWRAAVGAYESALSAGGDIDEADVLTALGRCYWNLSEARTAWRTLLRAISLFQQRGDGVGQARATLEISRIWGPPDRLHAMLDDALEALGDADPRLRALLLLHYRWSEETVRTKWEEARTIGRRHGFEDVLAFETHDEGWRALDERGDMETFVSKLEEAHGVYARLGVHDQAAQALRNAGFQLIETGQLDRGYAYAERCFDYASNVRMLFTAQLALMDMVAVRFARGEYDECEELLARSPGETDFRADLYRMWIAERRGDPEAALSLLVSPDRAGNTPTALGQIHAAAAGALYRAGRIEAAGEALDAWLSVDRGEDANFACFEGSVLVECLLDLATEGQLRDVLDAFHRQEERYALPLRFATLSGRAIAPLRAGVAAKLGLRDEAEREYRTGLEWCERERCEFDAELCRRGLAAIAAV